jgi:UDP-N-acetylmuramoylalanine--D-glutamate ligase
MHRYPAGSYFQTHSPAGKRITVMGLGLNGGGEEAVRFFLKRGAFVTATDLKSEAELAKTVRALTDDPALDAARLRFALGGHELADFADADAVIKNPAVKYEGNRFLAAARTVESDLSAFLALSASPIVAVTGSKGKSTTASAIHYGLCRAGFTAFLGGNIATSPLSFLEQTTARTPVVLELSSWQLADLAGRGILRPRVAVITPIMRDHQNWYGSMKSYVADKKVIYAGQDASAWTICAARDLWGDEFAAETPARALRYGAAPLPAGSFGAWLEPDGTGMIRLPDMREPAVAVDALLVHGRHNWLNVLNAALALAALGVPPETCRTVFAEWRGIPHRLEYFREWQPETGYAVRFYNDTTATVPEAAAAAVQAFGKLVHLIAGGTDKSLDFAPLADALKTPDAAFPAASICLLAGSGTDKLIPLLDERGVAYEGPYDSLEGLLRALRTRLLRRLSAARENGETDAQEIVVFSPGATSFGMFQNEFDRGERFEKAVAEIFRER